MIPVPESTWAVHNKEGDPVMALSEKVAYLAGLKEGLNLDETRPETKLFNAVVDVLTDTALTLDGMESTMTDLFAQLRETEAASAKPAEPTLAEPKSAEQPTAKTEPEETTEQVKVSVAEDQAEEKPFLDEELFEVECPSCGLLMYLDEEALAEGGIACPKCNKNLEFEVETDD